MNLEELKTELFKNNKFKEEYCYGDDSGDILKDMRIIRGLTQMQLSKKTGIKQESISRAEQNGCSLKYLNNVAKKLGLYLEIKVKEFKNSKK